MKREEISTAAEAGNRAAAAGTGPRVYNLFPLLAGTVSDWCRELPRIAALGFDWVFVNPFHQTGMSGSLYAIQDPDRLDPRFRDVPGGSDDGQVAGFCAAARRHGLKAMADLVVNHTARDATLAWERPELYRRGQDGDLLSPSAADETAPGGRVVWGDLAELDYERPEARAELTAHHDAYIARMQRLGFSGFRCDAAYKLPAEIWRTLIDAARRRDPAVVFAAETLGCTFAETRRVAAAGFDFLFNSFAWWDFRAPWALEQYEALRLAAGSIAFPENHDTDRVAARLGDTGAADELAGRYALAAFFSSGVLMPMGFEWGYRRRLHVVETQPGWREDTGIDISDRIAAINRLRAKLPALNVEGAQWRLGAPDAPSLALMRIDAGHVEAAGHAAVVIANPTPGPVFVKAGPLLAATGGLFGAFRDATPGEKPLALAPGATLNLPPWSVRIFAAERARLPAPPPSRRPEGEGRVAIERVTPELDGGRTAVKRLAGEALRVEADIYTDGHDKIAAEILYRVSGEAEWRRVPMAFVENDRWAGSFPLERNARYVFTIEAWRDPYASWSAEVFKKRAAGQDVRLETEEGVHLADAARRRASGSEAAALAELCSRLAAEEAGSSAQFDLLTGPEAAELLGRGGERVNLSRYPLELPVIADRRAAQFSAWYELFPRSASGDPGRHGTFDDVIARLPYVKEMGFDVLYFPPIHPIGTTNRKGRNNAVKAAPGDVGSPYAIGAPEGGHDAIHPELGTEADFRRLVAAAAAHGLEIALDFAINASPDHPWIKQHPEWFEWRPDGTIKFAENPPKKYEDIVNVHFYGESIPSLWYALRDVILHWVGLGVKIFRVDNPHTKPLPFWEWLIAEINGRHPDVLFLAEAFTRPKMMKRLAKAGYQQSYTYFTWRNTKAELVEYLTELAGEMGEYYRPNFFANTPDINPFYLQTSGRAGFIVRATLAAMLSSNWGIYSGFELCEGRPLPGKEEYLDSEKYELKAWDFARPGNIRNLIGRLNRIRRDNPALWDFRNVRFLNAWNDHILAFVKLTPQKDNCVFVLVNLDPANRQECTYEVPLWEFGLPDNALIETEDLLGGNRFTLHGKTHRIALDPAERSVAIWRLIPPKGWEG